jgi:hypothetical protein
MGSISLWRVAAFSTHGSLLHGHAGGWIKLYVKAAVQKNAKIRDINPIEE